MNPKVILFTSTQNESKRNFIYCYAECIKEIFHIAGMKKLAVIPARYAATRFPGKLMQLIDNRPVILHTWLNTCLTGLFDEVLVATDHPLIENLITAQGGKAVMTSSLHASGSDRIAEAIEYIDADIIVNVQGDEPFVNKNNLSLLLAPFEQDKNKEIKVSSLMHLIDDESSIMNPNHVKVVTDKNDFALYFSRAAIPHIRDSAVVKYYKHIGMYAYRKDTLMAFTTWPVGLLENAEKLEQLRYLENGIRIKMMLTNESTIGIDTPEDLEEARAMFQHKQ